MIRDGLYTVLKRNEWLRSAVRKWRNIVEHARIDVWVISGSERRGGHALTVLIAGQLETKNYLAELLFKEPFSETHHRMRRSRFQGEAAARGYGHAIAFVDTETPRPGGLANKRHVFRLRGWVRTELDLAYAAERIRCSSSIRKTDVRKIRKNGLTYDTTTDPQALERFYWDMYVPYARQEFGGKAIYMSYEEFRAGLKNPELLRVYKDGQVVAGMIILHHENDRPHWWILGMQNGDRELMKQGAMAALYLYGIEHLTERGYSRALLGGARPFLVDGVLQYKRKWGARLLAGDDGDPHWLTVDVVESTKAVRDFLQSCPLICEDEQGLIGTVFFDAADSDSNERMRRQTAELTALGVERVRAIELPPNDPHNSDDLREAVGKTKVQGSEHETRRSGTGVLHRYDSKTSH